MRMYRTLLGELGLGDADPGCSTESAALYRDAPNTRLKLPAYID
jgi:hypothetical protein